MKGVILAGGNGSRLAPMTKVTNKHLLPIYNKPMIFFPLETLTKAGIKEIIIITGTEYSNSFRQLLGNGEDFGCSLTYKVQEEAGGIAEALGLCEQFIDGGSCSVILGDNIFFDEFNFSDFKTGARVYIKSVHDPERFGVVEIDEHLNVISIEEKPKNPKSSFVQSGLYLYDSTVFEKIKNLNPSKRGELEISDLNDFYLKEKALDARLLKFEWTDAGTVESLFTASEFVRSRLLS